LQILCKNGSQIRSSSNGGAEGEREPVGNGGGRDGRGVGGDGGSGGRRQQDRREEEEEGKERGQQGSGPASKEIKVLYLNAQSIVRKVNELACVAESLKPDLILITESWCNSDVTNAFLSIDGYEIPSDLRADREDTAQGRGGGLLVYAKTGLKVLKIDTECKFRQYCMFLVNDIVFYLIYRSPNAPPQMMKDLESLVRGVKKNAILVGDFNLPDIDWEMGTGSARTAAFLEAIDDVMLTQMVDFSTQVKGNCLDLVLTNIPERIVDIQEARRLGKSDHEMILLTVGGCGGGV
jgi:hypothetical protein